MRQTTMSESQQHGFEFENQIKNLNMGLILGNIDIHYTSKFDIPPISVKAFNFKNGKGTIEFGSIKRMFENDEEFILVLVGWKQSGNMKQVVFSDSLYINKNVINDLKGTLSLETIYQLCNDITSYGQGQEHAARKWARQKKAEIKERTTYDVRFKIDSKKQRRIQCAIKLQNLYGVLNKEVLPDNKLCLVDIVSERRVRKNEKIN